VGRSEFIVSVKALVTVIWILWGNSIVDLWCTIPDDSEEGYDADLTASAGQSVTIADLLWEVAVVGPPNVKLREDEGNSGSSSQAV